MALPRDGMFVRTDVWRERKWLDLWSVVHFLSGASIGLGFYFLHFGATASVALTLLLLISYEMWEVIVRIDEEPTNRFMDVVVGMASFLPAFFIVAPRVSETMRILMFGFILTTDVVLSVFGWRVSQKAAELEKRMRAKYGRERERFLRQGARLRKRFKN